MIIIFINILRTTLRLIKGVCFFVVLNCHSTTHLEQSWCKQIRLFLAGMGNYILSGCIHVKDTTRIPIAEKEIMNGQGIIVNTFYVRLRNWVYQLSTFISQCLPLIQTHFLYLQLEKHGTTARRDTVWLLKKSPTDWWSGIEIIGSIFSVMPENRKGYRLFAEAIAEMLRADGFLHWKSWKILLTQDKKSETTIYNRER